MVVSIENAWFGLVLGALAVRSPYDESVSLSLVRANLARVVSPTVSHDTIAQVVFDLERYGLAHREGEVNELENCRLQLCVGSRHPLTFAAVGPTSFVVGALALHYAPLVPVSELRLAAYRLWLPREVDTLLYSVVARLRAERCIVSRDCTSDVDQWCVSLVTDERLFLVA